MRQAKKKLERNLAKDAKKNSKQFYSYLKKKTANKVTVGPLREGDELLTSLTAYSAQYSLRRI